MWADFQKEQFNRETIETNEGFITYTLCGDGTCYIHILYVKPEFRKEGYGSKLGDLVINRHNLKELYCYVDLTSNDPDLSLIAIMKGGYKIESSHPDRIVLKKIIGER